MRDLAEDLQICEKANGGPWLMDDGGGVYSEELDIADVWHTVDFIFIAEAREGWPHAIQRAVEAEKRIKELEIFITGYQKQIGIMKMELEIANKRLNKVED